MGERNADATYRAFNYPHHAASYWAMYHVARHYDHLKTRQPWQWCVSLSSKPFPPLSSPLHSLTPHLHLHPSPSTLRYLERAAKTSLRFSCGTGVMDGTVFREILHALKAEGELHSAKLPHVTRR